MYIEYMRKLRPMNVAKLMIANFTRSGLIK